MPLRIRQPNPFTASLHTVPTGVLTIDYGNSLATGLVGVYVPGGVNGGSNLVDPGNGDVSLYGSAVDNITGPEGLGMQALNGGMAGTCSAAQTTSLTAASIYWRGTNIADADTFAVLFGPDHKADYDAPIRDAFSIRTNSVASDGFQLVYNDGIGNVWTLPNGRGLAVGATGSVATTSLSGGSVISYRDGVLVTSGSFGSSSPIAFDATARMQIGGTDHFGRYSNTLTYVGYMWNRVLDGTEMATLDADPYTFLVAESSATYAAFSTPQDAGRRVIKIIGY